MKMETFALPPQLIICMNTKKHLHVIMRQDMGGEKRGKQRKRKKKKKKKNER